MQSIRTTLPEFDRFRNQSVSPPKLRKGDFFTLVLAGEALERNFQQFSTFELHTLPGRPCTEFAIPGSRLEICRRFLSADSLDTAFYANLPLQYSPIKEQCSLRIRVELARLPAPVIGEKNEAIWPVTL